MTGSQGRLQAKAAKGAPRRGQVAAAMQRRAAAAMRKRRRVAASMRKPEHVDDPIPDELVLEEKCIMLVKDVPVLPRAIREV